MSSPEIHRAVKVVFAIGALGAACGGIAVIDGEGSGGAAPTTTTGTMASQTSTTGSTMSSCEACLDGEVTSAGTVANGEITEASGIAASRIHDGVYYVHNDSGGAPRFFAIDAAGNDLGSYIVDEAAAVDWEDIATGPCGPDSTEACIFIGDIGDNPETRGSYVVYRVQEPASIGNGGNLDGDAITFMYPDGSHDAEALLVDPATGQLFIVTKSSVQPRVYRFADGLVPGTVVQEVGELTVPTGLPLVTGGSASERGALIRTMTNIILYDQGADLGAWLTSTGCPVAAPGELQGEAVSWRRDASGYVTVGEGQNQPVYEVRCGGR
jgi:hypothetical protein